MTDVLEWVEEQNFNSWMKALFAIVGILLISFLILAVTYCWLKCCQSKKPLRKPHEKERNNIKRWKNLSSIQEKVVRKRKVTEEKVDEEVAKKHELSFSRSMSEFLPEQSSGFDLTKSFESQMSIMGPMAHHSHIFATNSVPTSKIMNEQMYNTASRTAEYSEAELQLSNVTDESA